MAEPPLLSKPNADEVLYLYLTVSDMAINAVKEKERVQKPIYYVRKTLHGAKINYSTIEKFALAMITSRKLRPYFQAHKIEVLMDQPLRNIMRNPKASVRLVKWAIDRRI